MREINQAGLDLIKSFEGILDGDPSTSNLDPYLDPVGIWTIG
jgi:lysozyme